VAWWLTASSTVADPVKPFRDKWRLSLIKEIYSKLLYGQVTTRGAISTLTASYLPEKDVERLRLFWLPSPQLE
jgi:hypothetical protein